MSPTATKSYKKHKKLFGNNTIFCLAVADHQILGGEDFLVLVTRNRKNLVVEKGTTSPALGSSCVEETPSGCFRILAICYGRSFDEASEPCVSHHEWTKWWAVYRKIWLRTSSTLSKNANLWTQGNDRSFTGIHRRLQQNFPHMWQSFDVIFTEYAFSSAACCFRAPSMAILTSLQPAVDLLLGCSSGKTRSWPIGVRVCPVANSTFSAPRLTRVSGPWLYSGRKIRDVSPNLSHLRTNGGDETSSPSQPKFTSFDDPDDPFSPRPRGPFDQPCGPYPEPQGPPDPPDHPGFPSRLPPAPPAAGGERTRAVDQSRERSRPQSPSPEPQLRQIPMSDGDDDQPPQTGRQQWQRSRSRERSYSSRTRTSGTASTMW